MHHPPFSVSAHGGKERIRDAWSPLFEKYQVTAVFTGHDHVYSRFLHKGVPYFVTGGAGAPLYPRKERPGRLDEEVLLAFERVNHYMRVEVTGTLVDITAVRVDGTVIETIQVAAKEREQAVAPLDVIESPVSLAEDAGGPMPEAVMTPGPVAPRGRRAADVIPVGIIAFLVLVALVALGWSLH